MWLLLLAVGGCRWLPKQVQDIKELLQEAPLQDQ